MPAPKLTEQWVRLQYTNPFTVGGTALSELRYKVKATTHKTGNVKYGVYQEKNKKFTAFELTTGGRMHSAGSYNDVIQHVRRMIAKTPDMQKQIDNLGNIMGLEEVSTKEAHEILWSR